MKCVGKSAVFVLVIISALLIAGLGKAADQGAEEYVARQAKIVVPGTEYEWWLIRWSDNQTLCRIIVDHEGLPTNNEIYTECGKATYQQWATTPACTESEQGADLASDCIGLYFYLASEKPIEKSILVDLPPIKVWVTLAGCTPTQPENFCGTIPSLLFTGEEPLPNETISSIHAVMDGFTYTCEGTTCQIPLHATPMEGSTVEFWADSSYGDRSETFTALVRVIDSGVTNSATASGWYVDVLSSQWQGGQIASCAQEWQAFPPVGGLPTWLTTPQDPALLATDEPYSYLAGRLIAQGLVDTSQCPADGLLSNGYADACGLEQAMPMVVKWQNVFDERILEVSNDTGVPAYLMKNLFAQESQFWPGMYKTPYEYGLGQLTDHGAESLLLWDSAFYEQFCHLVLTESACAKGYIYLDEESKAILRGALAIQANADCAECPTGIDLSHANITVGLFAQSLLANCQQVSQIVFNATGRIPGSVSGYEDLWKFTVANYHIGPGCLSYSLYRAWTARAPMTLSSVSTFLTPACESVKPYVEKISGGQ